MKKLLKRYILVLCCVFLGSLYSQAQQSITGKVTDNNGTDKAQNNAVIVMEKTTYQPVAYGEQTKNSVTASIYTISGE